MEQRTVNKQQFASKIWESANQMRSKIEADESKDYKSTVSRITEKTSGARMPRADMDFVLDMELPLPPLSGQRRIVDLLARAEGIVRLRREAQDKARAVIPALFLDMFGDPATNPKGWRVANLGSITKIIGGSSLPAGEPFAGQRDGVMLLKVSDMNLPGSEVYVRACNEWAPDQKRASSRVHAQAIILPKRGAAIATNKKRLTTRPALLDPNLMAIEPDTSVVRPSFLFQRFCAFDLASITSGTTVPQLNRGDLSPLSVYLPPMSQQPAFEEHRKSILGVVAQQAAALTKAESTFQALLSRAFSRDPAVATTAEEAAVA